MFSHPAFHGQTCVDIDYYFQQKTCKFKGLTTKELGGGNSFHMAETIAQKQSLAKSPNVVCKLFYNRSKSVQTLHHHLSPRW